jgi:S-(hydroxymethyl)glutathione dehydrogenase/alcohol dehydrogenase
MKAQAAVFRDKNTPLSIETVDVSEPGPNEVLIRTAACGVCHSDLHFVQGAIPGPAPTIPGHEPAGVVEAIGANVRSVQVGDHVIACTSMFCGQCSQCIQGRPYLCQDRGACQRSKDERPRLSQNNSEIYQFADLSGFCDVMLVHERAIVKIDNDIPLDRAALIGCAVTTGVGAALNTAQVAPGSSVAVFGVGGVGISIVQGARIAGARQIIAVDRLDDRLAAATHFGATHTVNSTQDDPVKAIKRLSRGGVDYAFEAVGLTSLVEQAFYCLAPHGLATIVGVIPQGERLTLHPGHFYVEKRLQGCFMGSNRFHVDAPHYLELYRQNKLDLDAMVSERMPLGQINEAFRAMEAGEVTRTVLVFE